MQLDYRNNALDAMRARRIQPAEIIYTIEHPEVEYLNKTHRLKIYEEHPGGRLIIASVDARNPRWGSTLPMALDFKEDEESSYQG